MTKREWLAAAIREQEQWKTAWHYREGSLPYLLGADWMYPFTDRWYRGRPNHVGPSVRMA